MSSPLRSVHDECSTTQSADLGRTMRRDLPPRVADACMGRTTCAVTGNEATLEIEASAPGGAVVIIRARHLGPDNTDRTTLRITVDGVVAGKAILGATMEEHRIDTAADLWSRGKHKIKLEQVNASVGKFEVDHFLVVPLKAD